MNWLDIIAGFVILLFVIRGIIRGLFREGIGLICLIVGFIVAVNRYQQLGKVIQEEVGLLSLKISNIVAFVVIFVGIAIIGAIAGVLIHNLLYRYPVTRGLEEGGGFILGLIEGALICSVILLLISVSPFADKFETFSEGSILKPYLLKVGPFVYDSIASITPGKTKKFIEKLDPANLSQLSKNLSSGERIVENLRR